MYVSILLSDIYSASVLKQGKIYFLETFWKSSKNAIKLPFYLIFKRLLNKPQNLKNNESIIFNLPFAHRIIKTKKTKNIKSQYLGGKNYYWLVWHLSLSLRVIFFISLIISVSTQKPMKTRERKYSLSLLSFKCQQNIRE